MKKVFLMILITVGMLFCMSTVAGANSYTMWDIDVGDELSVYGYNSINSAGELDIYARPSGDPDNKIEFNSWCANQFVRIPMGSWHDIKSFATPSDQSAWLLSQYYAGAITLADETAEALFQDALWHYDDPDTTLLDPTINPYFNAAEAAIFAGWTDDGYVLIAELYDVDKNYQDIYVPGRPVPIPTSVLLLGAGLLGLIGIGYRRRKSTAE